MRVIWLKIRVLCPPARSFFIRRSSSWNFPHCSTRSCDDGNVSEPSSPPEMRSGWLQFLRSCISMLFSAVAPMGALPPLIFCSMSLMVLSTSASLKVRWVFTMCAYRMISFLRGRLVSTSPLSRRRRNGLRIPCNFSTTLTRLVASWSSVAFWSVEKSNQDWNCDSDENTSGSRKWRRLHSSGRLFCSGVPVRSSLLAAGICLSSRISLQSKFFRRWPSSTTRYLKLYFCRNLRSAMTISNEVTMAGKAALMAAVVGMRCARMSARSCLLPWYKTTGNSGQNLRNSLTQLGSVESGPMIR
mmetsp:Transcript_38287/g.95145  ORF Transcript_38287/g.95145 Transcript_38287/m.95145 type:complete len:300 (+) Transcript_38287:807-1706(+)